MRRGTRLGVDVGTARVGVARSDVDGMLAVPVETIQRAAVDPIERICGLAEEYCAAEIVVGLPVALSGKDTPSTQDARDVAAALAQRASAAHDGPDGSAPRWRVRLVDERLSTVTASSRMRAAGKSAKRQRSTIDQAAAVVILQHALDAERASGRPPGTEVAGGEATAEGN